MDYDIDKIVEQARKGNTKELLSGMKEADAQKIKNILNDKDACQQLLQSEQAKKILEMLKRGGIIGG